MADTSTVKGKSGEQLVLPNDLQHVGPDGNISQAWLELHRQTVAALNQARSDIAALKAKVGI